MLMLTFPFYNAHGALVDVYICCHPVLKKILMLGVIYFWQEMLFFINRTFIVCFLLGVLEYCGKTILSSSMHLFR